MNQRTRFILVATTIIVVVGLLVWAGFGVAQNTPMTESKLAEYTLSTDLGRLSGIEREEALRALAEKVNALSLEERRKWWVSGHWRKWFDAMTENEKNQYVDATLPVGFKQVLGAFENLPDAQRKQAIDDAMRKLKETHRLVTDHEPGHSESMYGTNAPPVLSAELENHARMLGFRTFYTDSSAETKAQLAPFIEELQHEIERPGHFQ